METEPSRQNLPLSLPAYATESEYTDVPIDADYAQAVAWYKEQGEQVFFPIYTPEESRNDPSRAATLGNADVLYALTGRSDISQAAAVIMQYTGHNTVSNADAPTYACVGTRDGIASWRTMESRLEWLEEAGIPTEFHAYEGLPHGFGLGTGTVAEGWLEDAVAFWEAQIGD